MMKPLPQQYRIRVHRTAKHRSGRNSYRVVACDRGIFFEQKKVWTVGYDSHCMILNLERRLRIGTMVNPTKEIFNR